MAVYAGEDEETMVEWAMRPLSDCDCAITMFLMYRELRLLREAVERQAAARTGAR